MKKAGVSPFSSRSRTALAAQAEPLGQGERFVSVTDVLAEVSQMGDNFVFEDNEEDQPVWDFEARLGSEPPTEAAVEPEVKRVLDPEQADILSAYSSEQGFRELTVDDLKARLEEGAGVLVLDVRSDDEYASGHVPGALNMPLDRLSAAVKGGELEQHKEQSISVICASGSRSAQATVRLTKVFGFKDVANVRGGTRAWVGAGHAVEAVQL
ncbi:hypothetical protein WJX72_000345 [[Myrmecia] bisecta]|uniref:Rhodanese domain-containing protein n=1 Tax=[Myrmecia] bisecta TaxID=41462 RepID=A0AAW1PW46_9CHLO